jgi:outer membrane protein OmpA-like peptidoglycan-associated protein
VQTITTPSHEAPNTPLEVKLQDYLEQSRISFGKDVQPYTTSHTLLQAETQRLTSEYDHLIDILTLNADYYEVNQSKLTPIMEQMLDQKIATLSRYNSNRYTITIEGHTCDLGSNNFNMDLAERRAEEVRNYMVKHGFNRQNIRVVSKGETTPIVPNIDEPHRKTNRRVVFLIQERQ